MSHSPRPADVHHHTHRNRDELSRSAQCGCCFCLKLFHPSAIEEWWDSASAAAPTEGQTAVCPHCGIDAVLGSASGYPLSRAMLRQLRAYAF